MKGPSCCCVGSVMRVQVKNCVMLPIILDSSPLPPVVVCLCLKLTFFTMLIDISEYKLSVFIKCMMGSLFSIYVLTLLVSELNWIIYPICVCFFIHFVWLNDYSAEAGSELTLSNLSSGEAIKCQPPDTSISFLRRGFHEWTNYFLGLNLIFRICLLFMGS